jgi:phosphatidylglycerol---prolipoprotein diacylglyceryl transferase
MTDLAAAHPEPLSSIAFQLGPLSVHWYGVILGFAVLVGLLIAIREGKKHGYEADLLIDLVLVGVPMGIIGGRLYYVAFNWSYYMQNPGKIFAVWEGGLAIHGVLIAAVLVSLWYARRKQVPFLKLLDMLAPGIILAQAIGRWGNFMNQEAHGGPVSREFLEGLRLPEFIINQMYIDGQYFHPTFLYESVWNVLGFILLILLRRIDWQRFKVRIGEIFFAYLIWYSCGRFFIEGMRTDSLMVGDVIRTAQLMSVALILAGIIAIIYRRQKGLGAPYWAADSGNPNGLSATSSNARRNTKQKKKNNKRKKKK